LATPDRQKQMLRSAQAALKEQSEVLAGVPDFEKPKDLGLPERYRGVPAGSALEKEIASALSTPKKNRTPAQDRLADRYADRVNERWTDASRQDREESSSIQETVRSGVRR